MFFVEDRLAPELAILDVVPNLFVWIDMRGMLGEEKNPKLMAMRPYEISDFFRGVEACVINDKNDWTGMFVQNLLQETDVFLASNRLFFNAVIQIAFAGNCGKDIIASPLIAGTYRRGRVDLSPGPPRTRLMCSSDDVTLQIQVCI